MAVVVAGTEAGVCRSSIGTLAARASVHARRASSGSLAGSAASHGDCAARQVQHRGCDQGVTAVVARAGDKEQVAVWRPRLKPVGGGLAGAGQRRFARGHEPVFGVVIDEDVDRVAHLVGERNVAVGQQYLLPLLIGEIETVVRDTGHGERMVLSGFHS